MELQMCLEKEQFSSLNSHQYSYNYTDNSDMDPMQNISVRDMYEWELENEKELNGDLALIPELGESRESMNKIIDSPPSVDLHRLMNELHDFISIDPVNMLPMEENFMPQLHDNDGYVPLDHPHIGDPFNVSASGTFDLTEYLSEEEPKSEQTNFGERKPRAGVKKIDLKAQKYIVDNDTDESSTEEESGTYSDIQNTPVLEACDLFSLLEQFEATEMPELPSVFLEETANSKPNIEQTIKKEPTSLEQNTLEESNIAAIDELEKEIHIDVENITSEPNPFVKNEIKVEPPEKISAPPFKLNTDIPHHSPKPKIKVVSKSTQIAANTKTKLTHESRQSQSTSPQETVPQDTKKTTHPIQNTATVTVEDPAQVQSRKALNELPQDLISRIKESRKRKTIAVIPPIPTKKRGGPKVQENPVLPIPTKTIKIETVNSVDLDHSYCSKSFPEQVKKEPASADEDERSIIMKQPIVKNHDGKMMVSLLKVNTIHAKDLNQKKKLDIEEYKKRREGKIKLQGSQSNSTSSSSCSSPVPEDEKTRILKHQEKLMRMAMEVLKTRPKSETKQEPSLPVVPPVQLQIPPDMEKKTFVSIGVNTEFKICKNLDPVRPVQQLEEMKPLLEKASNKFNCNSLITSLIENIPKVINKTVDVGANKTSSGEHGEDKTIVYLPKNRVPKKTNTVAIQTNISLVQQTKEGRYRRRRDSSSSSSSSCVSKTSKQSSHYSRKRDNSDCSSSSSKSSKRSYYSSSSRSRSRSRSRSPPRYAHWEQERFREVEERRVVYVGRISSKTTKDQLRQRFERFGPITNMSLHFRDHGYLDNYGFVTFANQYDAFEAIEHANDDPYYPKYDLSFGGRRQFCITSYSDLDNMRDETTYYPVPVAQDSFDALLKEAQEKLRRRKF